MTKLEDLLVKLNSIAVFRALLSDEVVIALREFLQTQKKSDLALTVDKYSEFVSKLYNKNCTNLVHTNVDAGCVGTIEAITE